MNFKQKLKNPSYWQPGMALGVFLFVFLVWLGLLDTIPVKALSLAPDADKASRVGIENTGGKFSIELSALQQITPTVTSTASATATGTIVPDPVVSVSVLPGSAFVGQQLAFTIVVRNNGTAPALDVAIFDNFPVVVDVLNVLASRGVVTVIPHSVVVSIGTLNPGEVVTIVITTIVNSGLTTTLSENNVVNMTYDPGQVRSASVPYLLVVPTATATETATATSTFPATDTATASPTVTGTPPTVTPTSSRTATASLTATGTPPTPTFTGTIVPNPSISISVYPTSATVNQQLTFSIIIKNNGNAPAINAVLTDSLPAYLDVQTVATTKGSVTKTSHSATISIGTINPNETVTVVIPTLVNGSLSRTETQSNLVSLTYNNDQVRTASITYTAILTTVLPNTGQIPIFDENPVPWSGLLFGFSLFTLVGMMVAIRRGHKITAFISIFAILVALLVVGVACSPSSSGNLASSGDGSQASLQTSSDVQPTMTRTLMPFRPAYEFATPEAIVTLPSYPIPTPDLKGTELEGKEGSDISPVERIVIPSLSVDTIVKYVPYDETKMTWLIEGLREEVAWLGQSSWPGLGGNTVLAGHITVTGLGDGPFRYLEDLAEGDKVLLYTQEKTYTYQVREQVVVDDTNVGVALPTVKSQLTLITCTGWDDEIDLYRYRRVIFADLVSAENLNHQSVGQ